MDAHEKSYWYSWMTIKDNSRLYEPLPPRIPSFCLIDAHSDNDYETISYKFRKIKKPNLQKVHSCLLCGLNHKLALKLCQRTEGEGTKFDFG